MSVAPRLRAIRYLYSHRSAAPGARDIAYLVYLVALTAGIVGAPVIRAIVARMSTDGFLATLASADFRWGAACVIGAIGLGFVALGRLRGPVLPDPFRAALLTATELPRRRTLLRPFILAALWPVVVAAAATSLLAGVAAAAGLVADASVGVVIAIGVLIGAIWSFAWLAGQALRPAGRFASAGIVVAAAAGGYGALVAGGWLALLGVAVLLALAGAVAVPALLARMDADRLLASATMWQLAATASIVGDIQHAAGLFRQLPTRGRGLRAIGTPAALLVPRTDVVAALRTPLRLVIGSAAAIAGSLLLALSARTAEPWAVGGIGLLVVYLAVGVVTDGFRHSAQCAAMPALYGLTTRRLYLWHAVLPLAFALLAAVVGSAIAIPLGAPLTAAALAAIGAIVAVADRALDSAKGDLPPELLTPQPTPMGDMSGIMVLLWQADAVTIAFVAGALLASGTLVSAPVIGAGVCVYLLHGLRKRLRALA